MDRTRRSAKVKPHALFAELRRNREEGTKRNIELEETEDLYDEIDDEDYKKVVRDRLNQDDFVVDDAGEGYVDNGMDDWGQERELYTDEEDEEESNMTTKEKKRKREEDKEKKEKQDGALHKYFNKTAATAPVKQKVVSTVQDKEFIDDLLGEFDTTMGDSSRSTKKRREEPARKSRKLSPPRKIKKFAEMRSSPPPEGDYGGDDDDDDVGFMPAPMYTDDTPMSDAPVAPSSPSAHALERRLPNLKVESDDEEEFAVAAVKGNRHIKNERVNITASRPAKPVFVPQPVESSLKKSAEIDSSAWTSVSGGLNVMDSVMPEASSLGKLSKDNAFEEDGSIKFFWMDYTEVHGALLLFGKAQDKSTGKYVSAFLKVDGMMRNLFVLPREHRMDQRSGTETNEEVEMTDVHQEVSNLLKGRKIEEFKAKSSERKYAFELPNIPRKGDYLKVLYPYTRPALPDDLEGETYSHVFGTNTALFEQFVLCRNIMGPCWLKIDGAETSTVAGASWCKLEISVKKPQQVTPIGNADSSEAPPLTLMSIALRTMHNVKQNKQEIVAISCRIYENVNLADATTQVENMPHQVFTVVRPIDTMFPAGFEKLKEKHKGNMLLAKTESMLLSSFLAKLQQVDPDVLIGHQLENVDYPVLIHRLKEKKTTNWSRIGRMKRTQWPSSGGRFAGSFFADRALASGRLMCDLANDLGKSLMLQCQSWSLSEMCDLILGTKRQELDNEDALKSWASTGKGFWDYLVHCEVDTHFIASIALKIQMLPLTKQLTNLAGNSWARTLGGTRAERNEYILLHEFYRGKFICPDKTYGKQKVQANDEENADEGDAGTKKKDKFKGGLVFEPEKGLYDKYIIVMDYNSLYPSIIQEFNICFTTVHRADTDEDTIPEVPDDKIPGVLPRLISTLVQRRRQVKGLMKDKKATPVQLKQWDIKQQALKLTANSMYGCLGYTRSRFYARPLAMLTTFKGREILQSTKDLAESKGLRVIYGDTDSVMINTLADNYADAIKIGNEFKKAVNSVYGLLEIDIDNVFQRLLLHAKKKYAAMNCIFVNGKLESKMEVKGLDMRRREFCQLSKDASAQILNEVFTGEENEVVVEKIHDYLRELAEKVREGKFPTQKYTIYTKLGKNPEEYPMGKTMPQVQVALRKKARGEPVKVGDVISYIITEGPEGANVDQHAAERAYATQDVLKPDSGLKPDPEWYLIKQIFPPIERLCGPIEGTDSLRIAECLGLDTRKYQIVSSTAQQGDHEIHPLESNIPDEERFKNTRKLTLRCRKCKESFDFEGLAKSKECCTPQGIACTHCKNLLPVPSIIAQVEYQLRQSVAKYYDAWLVCDDSSCANRTRQMSVYGKRCLGSTGRARGCKGVMHYEYTDKMLYNQLLYFKSLFDVEKQKEKAKSEDTDIVRALAAQYSVRFGTVDACVGRYLEKCGRQWVGMENIFGFSIVA